MEINKESNKKIKSKKIKIFHDLTRIEEKSEAMWLLVIG